MGSVIKAFFFAIGLAIAVVTAEPLSAQPQLALSFPEEVASVCQKHFPRGASYTGTMYLVKSGQSVPTNHIRWDIATCGAGQFDSGERAIVISGDLWMNGHIKARGRSLYFGLRRDTLTHVRSAVGDQDTIWKTTITLENERNFVQRIWFPSRDESATMTRQ